MIMNIEKYDDIMYELQELWKRDEGIFSETHHNPDGIRSSQIAALVALLVEYGVFNKDK